MSFPGVDWPAAWTCTPDVGGVGHLALDPSLRGYLGKRVLKVDLLVTP